MLIRVFRWNSITARTGRLALLLLVGGIATARADDAPATAAATTPAPNGIPDPSIATSLPILADPGGIRSALAKRGVTFGLNYIGETLADVSGGARRGGIYDGRFEFVFDADLGKLWGLQGAAVHFNAYQIQGTGGLTRDYVDNLATVSSIEALPSTRLYEAWFEQTLADGKVAVRAGQLAGDTEFMVSKYAGLFVNSTFGWPALTAADLPDGGPAYPLATPGVRLKLQPNDRLALLLAVYDGDPAGPGAGNPQKLDRYGLNFRVTDPPLVVGEAQYSYSLTPDLPGTVKLGAWDHFGSFDDLRSATDGLSLANPASSGMPLMYSGDDGAYGVVDQLVYHPPGSDAGNGIGVFGRLYAAPPNRNLIDLYADGGINLIGMTPGRPNDTIGLGFAYAHISKQASHLDEEQNFFTAINAPVRDYEGLFELTYQAQVVPGWTIQPDFQYIFHPGGHIANPNVPGGTTPIRNAAVIGIRTTINY